LNGGQSHGCITHQTSPRPMRAASRAARSASTAARTS
jgi:hypothetical protein